MQYSYSRPRWPLECNRINQTLHAPCSMNPLGAVSCQPGHGHFTTAEQRSHRAMHSDHAKERKENKTTKKAKRELVSDVSGSRAMTGESRRKVFKRDLKIVMLRDHKCFGICYVYRRTIRLDSA